MKRPCEILLTQGMIIQGILPKQACLRQTGLGQDI